MQTRELRESPCQVSSGTLIKSGAAPTTWANEVGEEKEVVTKFYQILEGRRLRGALVNIRREFEKAGYHLDHVRDSQIEAVLTCWTEILRK